MPVDGVVMRNAVFIAVGPIPPAITHFDSIVGAYVLCFFHASIPVQACQRTVGTESMKAIEADFLAVVITRVMAEFFIVLWDTKCRAILAMPAVYARLTSVRSAVVMSAIVVARNALRTTVAAKPRR